jgi:hypothetical protein
MLADRVGEVAESLSQPLDRRQLRVGLDAGAEALDERLEAGDVETLLATEVLEDQTVGDSGGLGDLVDRDLVIVAVAEDLERCVDQLEPALSCPFSCQGRRGD